MQLADEIVNASASRRTASRLRRIAARILFAVILFGITVWAVFAVLWSNLPAPLRPVAAVLYAIAAIGVVIRVRHRTRRVLLLLAGFACVVTWWLLIPPSNTRDWQPDVRTLTAATIDGNKVQIHHLRHCVYRSETDYDVRYEDRSYDLNKLRTLDLYVVYWGSPLIAHTMMSFGFEGDDYVCISIETRKEKGESYSAVKGFFKQYELVYVVADERDLVKLRTNYRGEDVYLYRLQITPDVIRNVFVDYLMEVNDLNERAVWYNALTQNCTTSIREHTLPYVVRRLPGWKMILNGHVDELAYENGTFDHSLPFPELKKRSLVNDRARAAGDAPDFSKQIRAGLPGMEKKP